MKKLYLNFVILLLFFLFFHPKAVYANDLPPELQDTFEIVSKPGSSFITDKFYAQNMVSTSLENFDNRFIILHFWASWCMDCSIDLVQLNKLQKEFRKKSLLVIAISEDYKDVKEIDKYFGKHEIDYLDIYLDKKNEIYRKLMLNNLPASYLIDFNGKVIAKSKIGKKIDWTSDAMLNFLEEKVSKFQLLPPEYKKIREKYEAPEVPKNEIQKKKKIVRKEDF